MDHPARRLEALSRYDILDTPPEPEFNDVVQVAARVCQTPVALISLVAEDRQWFKARVGFEPCETPMGQSVCAHALVVEDLLVIPDLTLDPRTCDNTLVTQAPHIRFYAGAVLRTPDNVAIGSLCVIDDKPRPDGLTPDQAQTLLALGRQTMVIMALRRAMMDRDTALQASVDAEKSMLLAQDAARVGTFEIDVGSAVMRTTPAMCRIFGLPAMPTYAAETIENLILPEDRRLSSSDATRRDASAQLDVEYRIRRANDGTLRWISRRGDFRFDKSGTPLSLVGVVQDITERKIIDLRSTALVDFGDRLRDADAATDATGAAVEMLGTLLGASRAGYCVVDLGADSLSVESDWAATGLESVVGRHPLAPFRRTITRLRTGDLMAIANIPAASFLAHDVVAYDGLGAKAVINIPYLRRGELVGLIFVHSAIPRTWSVAEIDFAHAVADRTYAAVARMQAEAQQKILNEELSHRLKNTLSMVQAIATQTLRTVTEKDAVRAFEDRLIALSRAHDVLLQQSWSAARIRAVVDNTLDLHGDVGRYKISGPDVVLGPKATLSMSLILHELITNASKYGALSAPAGRVELTWNVERDKGGGQTFHLLWAERHGPPATAPTRRGFGTRLLSMGLAGAGQADLQYASAGLIAAFRAPLRAITEG